MTALYGSRDTSLKYRQQIPWTPANKAFMFESCVILNGSKTLANGNVPIRSFESCVIFNGSKTKIHLFSHHIWFERCVILDGSKIGMGKHNGNLTKQLSCATHVNA